MRGLVTAVVFPFLQGPEAETVLHNFPKEPAVLKFRLCLTGGLLTGIFVSKGWSAANGGLRDGGLSKSEDI